MVKDVLVTGDFSEAMRSSGERLLKRLDKAGGEVWSAFWSYSSAGRSWRFIIASPKVDREGPRNYYKIIIAANAAKPVSKDVIFLGDVSITSVNDPFVQLLRSAIGTGKRDISGVRFSRSTINGAFIEDCYIYRSYYER